MKLITQTEAQQLFLLVRKCVGEENDVVYLNEAEQWYNNSARGNLHNAEKYLARCAYAQSVEYARYALGMSCGTLTPEYKANAKLFSRARTELRAEQRLLAA